MSVQFFMQKHPKFPSLDYKVLSYLILSYMINVKLKFHSCMLNGVATIEKLYILTLYKHRAELM